MTQHNHVLECDIYINIQDYAALKVSFLHVRKLCLVSLHLMQRARA
jgi:hypothetical protein